MLLSFSISFYYFFYKFQFIFAIKYVLMYVQFQVNCNTNNYLRFFILFSKCLNLEKEKERKGNNNFERT